MSIRHIFITLCFIGLVGCAKNDDSFLGSAYHNFTSYFNAYYNASQEFDLGIDALEKENSNISIEQITIFPEYQNISSATAHFDKVIDKTSKILTNHPKSDLADNGLLLMGKSFFYKREFEPAERKFQEILTNYFNGNVRDDASFWYARTLAEQFHWQEAIEILMSVVESEKTSKATKSNAYYLMADLHMKTFHNPEAIDLINKGLKLGGDDKLKTRAAFCLAKLYESVNDFEAASKAFQMVLNTGTEYDLRFEALKNYGIILRERHQYLEAVEIFKDLLSDDKNLDYFPTLRYELAITYAKSKKLSQAIDLYFEIIQRYPKTEATALSYFQLGLLRQTLFSDYKSAAALYDSAKTHFASGEVFQQSTRSYNLMKKILDLKESITQLDSVISLGVLDKSSIQAPLRFSKTDSLKTSASLQENLLAQRTRKDYRKSAFLARGSKDVFQTKNATEKQDATKIVYQAATDSMGLMNYELELIHKNIQMGQVFYLDLERLDSAISWYFKALDEIKSDPFPLNDSLELKREGMRETVLFSLASCYKLLNKKEQVDSIYQVILTEHPKSQYINRVRRYFNMAPVQKTFQDSLLSKYENAIKLMDSGNAEISLKQLKSLIPSAPRSLAPKIYLGIGHIYEYELTNPDSALYYYHQLKSLYPASKEAKQILKKVTYAEKALADTLTQTEKNLPSQGKSNQNMLPEVPLTKE